MRTILLVACLSGLAIAEDAKPFVRITRPTDGSRVQAKSTVQVRGHLDHPPIADVSTYKVQLRVYQAASSRLKVVREVTSDITQDKDDKELYHFQCEYEQPAGTAACVVHAEVLETAPGGRRRIARDLVSLAPTLKEPDNPREPAESEETPRDRRTANVWNDDFTQYVAGCVLPGFGSVSLNDQTLPLKSEAWVRVFRFQAGKRVLFQSGRVPLTPAVRPDNKDLHFSYRYELKAPQPGGHYVVSVDIVDPAAPEKSLIRDAKILEVVDDKPAQPAKDS